MHNEECSLIENTLEEKLEPMLECLLNKLRKDKYCTLALKFILYSALKALLYDLMAGHAKDLTDLLARCPSSLERIMNSNGQLVMPAFYLALNGITTELNGSDPYESKLGSRINKIVNKFCR